MLKFILLCDLLLEEKPCQADVVVWLQGDRYDRGYKVIELYKKKFSKKILISGNNLLLGSRKLGEDNISLDDMVDFLIKKGVNKRNIIIDDDSMNTLEQAINIFKIIQNKKWKKIILVGSSYYQPRAFLTFLKQADNINWDGLIINQPALIDWNKKPSGRDKIAKSLFLDEYKKTKKYKNDLFSINKGIKYFYNN